MSARETYFESSAGVPVHYDRGAQGYGSRGVPNKFYCRKELKIALNKCLRDLFNRWPKGTPSLILSAGTIGDGENAHGQGKAFDLDGFYFGNRKIMMDEYPSQRKLYIGINAHMFLYFSQVLSYHYPRHHDHFHVDFNFSYYFRTSSNAQTFFLQSALVYLYGENIGDSGVENDGVDGVYGDLTKNATARVLRRLNLSGQGGLRKPAVWRKFLLETRKKAFS